jgi:capsular polysaccharide biosynthesis protein
MVTTSEPNKRPVSGRRTTTGSAPVADPKLDTPETEAEPEEVTDVADQETTEAEADKVEAKKVESPVVETNGHPPADDDATSGTSEPDDEPNEPPVRTVRPVKLNTRGDVDRVGAIWQAKVPIVLGVVVVAVLVFLISSVAPKVYSSSATVSIAAASTPGGSAEDQALASNDLAAQDAQVVNTNAVLAAASKATGASSSELGSHLSSGTVAAQNLVQITMQSSNADQAQQWAHAVATSFKSVLLSRAATNAAELQKSVNTQAASLDSQIAGLKVQIAADGDPPAGSAALAVLESQENQLTNLETSRATLTSNTAIAVASEQPDVSIVVSGTAPVKESPKPALYALIGALIALLVGCQLAVVMARRRLARSTTA